MERIPFIGCINLSERDDRYNLIRDQFEDIGVGDRVHWHRPHRHQESGRIGCFESHLAVFEAALEKGAPFAVIVEDDVCFSSRWEDAFQRLLALVDSGISWNHASLHNSGGEVRLVRRGDATDLPQGVLRAAFYFTKCYAITRQAMERAVRRGVTRAHVDVALAVANWGKGFIIRPAGVLDVPSRSDKAPDEAGWSPWLAGRMHGYSHVPGVIADRWKTGVLPLVMSAEGMEYIAWRKFMQEPGSQEHIDKTFAPKLRKPGSFGVLCCAVL
mmetsp:Transcript_48519/g.139330  ORF Transcript_48519/g.139330 Transcript_48519/m.139330 type:complete len:271 (+) Transcript_48519:64-876(+)